MDFQEVCLENMDWIDLSQVMDSYRQHVNAVMDFLVL